MKRLVIIRHAQAENYAPTDFSRNLTSDGIIQMEMAAEKLATELTGGGGELSDAAGVDISSTKILASAAARTVQSARVVARVLGIPTDKIDLRKALYHANHSDYLNGIAVSDDSVEYLIVVGHNPAVSLLVGELMGGEIAPMRKGSIAVFTAKIDRWQDICVTHPVLSAFII